MSPYEARDYYAGFSPAVSAILVVGTHVGLGLAMREARRLEVDGRKPVLARRWLVTFGCVLLAAELFVFAPMFRLSFFGRFAVAETTGVVEHTRRGNPRSLVDSYLEIRWAMDGRAHAGEVRVPGSTADAIRDVLVYELEPGDYVDVNGVHGVSRGTVVAVDPMSHWISVRRGGGHVEVIDLGTDRGRMLLDTSSRARALHVPILVSGDVVEAGRHPALHREPVIALGLALFVLALGFAIHRAEMGARV